MYLIETKVVILEEGKEPFACEITFDFDEIVYFIPDTYEGKDVVFLKLKSGDTFLVNYKYEAFKKKLYDATDGNKAL